MSLSSIPKPALKSCDETSVSLTWEGFNASELNADDIFKVQYKVAAAPWTDSLEVVLPKNQQEMSNIQDLVDLEPGTPYSVRFVISRGDKNEYGPETVVDTKPISCTPKERKCSIM
mmetsp:Transcript_18233/g.18301  ORF Transcript_18233/g.18301 Transcript_18233/m.18301 type:complete len:116 (-) Transcript_18233:63-410(-)|eukprot:CAMPEP_0182416856 /NCGR_PEP_ID=MMETSP1167-20130531/1238_1 /TAXON_ID=2988 /ORGANISM="Mallomonas Sp, Strain CCMP3275" /LENGTH=115 /DNA_ID=CAMNT_0024589981 /DNA_START=225 /DNA_END=572 /DNA_ORIENTATION=+